LGEENMREIVMARERNKGLTKVKEEE